MEFNYKIEDKVSLNSFQAFRFSGIDKKHESRMMIELLLVVTSMDGRGAVLKAYVYVIEADVTFLVRRKTLENWGSILNTRRNVFETEIEGTHKNYRMITIT